MVVDELDGGFFLLGINHETETSIKVMLSEFVSSSSQSYGKNQ